MGDAKASCSFCGKREDEVERVIAGPIVSICDECIRFCFNILEEETANVGDRQDPAYRGLVDSLVSEGPNQTALGAKALNTINKKLDEKDLEVLEPALLKLSQRAISRAIDEIDKRGFRFVYRDVEYSPTYVLADFHARAAGRTRAETLK